MKIMKIFLIMLTCILMVGCSTKRVALDDEEFVSIMSENNYEVVDSTYNYDYAQKVYTLETDNMNIFYLKGNKKNDVENLYIDECSNVYNILSGQYEKEIHGGDNWTSLKVTYDDTIYYLSWIDNTYIYFKTIKANDKKLMDIIDKLGY